MTLRTRLLLLVLIALLPPLALLGWEEVQAGRARQAAAEAQAVRLARLVATGQQRIAEGARQTLTLLAGLATTAAEFEDSLCGPVLARVKAEFPRYAALGTTDAEGRVRCTARPEDRGTSVADRAYVQRALAQDGFVVGDYVLGRGSGQASFHFAQRFQDTEGRLAGIAFAAIGLDWLTEELGRLPLPGGAAVAVIDQSGTMLARWPRMPGIEGRRAGQVLPLLAQHGEGVVALTGLDGVPRTYGYVPPALTGGTLVAVGLRQDLMMLGAEAARRNALLLLLATTLLALLLTQLLGWRLLQGPVQRLVAATERWRAGDTAARVGGSFDRQSEFGQLGDAFDRLAETTAAREQALLEASRQAERDAAALAESEARFRAMADNIPQLAWMARPDGWIFWYNQRWFDYTGTTLADVQGWGWRQVHHPGHVERVVAHFSSRVLAGEPWEDTFPLRARDGSWRWFLSRAEPIRDAAGAISLWFGTNTDVTEQRTAAEVNGHLAAIVTSTSNAIISFDAADGRIRSWNRGAEALFGYTAAEALGRPAGLLVPPELPEGDPTGVFNMAMRGEVVHDHETVRIDRDGTRIPVSITAARMMTPDGRLVGVSGIFQDLRARKAAERQQALLVREVDHRAKNVMAVVRSLVRMSPRGLAPEAFVEKLDGRIAAMARTHSLLARDRWVGAAIAVLAREELDAHAGMEGEARIALDGPAVMLRADAAQPLAMVLHELATNSAKCGALAMPQGRLRLAWWRGGPDGALELRWEERGGPPVAGPPTRLGFGSRLIASNIRHQLGGTISHRWEREGLDVEIRIPARWIIGTEAPQPDVVEQAGAR